MEIIKLLIYAALLFGGFAFAAWWLHRAFFGKCTYCGSTDIVPDDGVFFYCNECKRKS